MGEKLELPESLEETKALRIALVERINSIDLRFAEIRATQPEVGKDKRKPGWDEAAKSEFQTLLLEKKQIEQQLPRLTGHLRDLNWEASSENDYRMQFTDEEWEERRRKGQLYYQARMRLVSRLAIPNPDRFLKRASDLLANIAADFEQSELSEEEWLIIKTFRAIMCQPKPK